MLKLILGGFMDCPIATFQAFGQQASAFYASENITDWADGDILKAKAMEIYNSASEFEKTKMREVAQRFLWSLKLNGG